MEDFAGGSKYQIVQNHHYEREIVVLDCVIRKIGFERTGSEVRLVVVKHFFKKVNFLEDLTTKKYLKTLKVKPVSGPLHLLI